MNTAVNNLATRSGTVPARMIFTVSVGMMAAWFGSAGAAKFADAAFNRVADVQKILEPLNALGLQLFGKIFGLAPSLAGRLAQMEAPWVARTFGIAEIFIAALLAGAVVSGKHRQFLLGAATAAVVGLFGAFLVGNYTAGGAVAMIGTSGIPKWIQDVVLLWGTVVVSGVLTRLARQMDEPNS